MVIGLTTYLIISFNHSQNDKKNMITLQKSIHFSHILNNIQFDVKSTRFYPFAVQDFISIACRRSSVFNFLKS